MTELNDRFLDLEATLAALNVSHLVAEFDMSGNILAVNDRFLDVFGYNAADVIGKHHSMLFEDPNDNSENPIRFWEALNRGEYRVDEHRRIGNGGRLVCLRASYSPVRDASGKPYKIVKYAVDITAETINKEMELRRRAEIVARDEFLANMSHELRTPLTSIIGFSQIIGPGSQLSENDQRYISLIRSASEGLLAIVNDILDFSCLEAGSVVLKPEPVVLSTLIEQVGAFLTPQAQSKGLDLQWHVAQDGILHADPARMRQILSNLVGNAIKFTQIGTVTVEAYVNQFTQTKSILEARVIDTGPGIVPEQIERLFDRFTQSDETASRKFGGAGLGLAISRRLVTLMGGQLTGHSDGKTGSVFSFQIPFEAVAPPIATMVQPLALARPMRILLAEDHPANRILVTALLSAFDIDLDCVEDGLAAVEAAKTKSYDAILMDMQMPVMDGVNATRAIRASSGPERDVPILALTANILHDQVKKCLDAGMQAHLAKPLNLPAVVAALNQHARDPAAAARPFMSRSA